MTDNRGLRISGGLPRGGLGFGSILAAVTSFAVSFRVPLTISVPLSMGCLLLGGWCAAGLHRYDKAGEISDRFVWRKRPDVGELLSGDRTDTELRISTLCVVLCIVALAMEAGRFFYERSEPSP